MSRDDGLTGCVASCPAANGEGENLESCRLYARLSPLLCKHFGFTDFRPGQLEAILPVLHGRDVFVKMATGSGKTLCMFLPPLVRGEASSAVIISPLVGLMEEQVQKLHHYELTAIHASVKNSSDYRDVASGNYRFVFMCPETAVTHPWRGLLQEPFFKANLALVAIDEAHCIKEWGSSFRTAFSQLGGLRALTKAPFMALTASAPPPVEEEIIQSLFMVNPVRVTHDLNRANIFYVVRKKTSLQADLDGLAKRLASRVLQSIPKTIVFCTKKDVAVQVFRFLRQAAFNPNYVGGYHASLSAETKRSVYDEFVASSGEVRVLCATIAFGMGMDVPDVTLVINYGLPDTMSQFYQLSGQAGRNGAPSCSYLYVHAKQLKNCSDAGLKDYASDSSKENCRRKILLASLGSACSHRDPLTCCDHCRPQGVPYDLELIKGRRGRKRKPQRVRQTTEEVREELQARLLQERKSIVTQSIGYQMLGAEVVCHGDVIREICARADTIQSANDLKVISGLRPDLVERFYFVITDVLSTVPPSSKR